MTYAITAKRGTDLEAQICEEFDRLPSEVDLFVWLPDARKLFHAWRTPRVEIVGDEALVEDGYTVELHAVRYSPPVLRLLLSDLGLIGRPAR